MTLNTHTFVSKLDLPKGVAEALFDQFTRFMNVLFKVEKFGRHYDAIQLVSVEFQNTRGKWNTQTVDLLRGKGADVIPSNSLFHTHLVDEVVYAILLHRLRTSRWGLQW